MATESYDYIIAGVRGCVLAIGGADPAVRVLRRRERRAPLLFASQDDQWYQLLGAGTGTQKQPLKGPRPPIPQAG
jgi:hypothetical protein